MRYKNFNDDREHMIGAPTRVPKNNFFRSDSIYLKVKLFVKSLYLMDIIRENFYVYNATNSRNIPTTVW